MSPVAFSNKELAATHYLLEPR